MEDTCNKECPLWKKYKDKCPNYVESWWQSNDGGEPKLVKDCAPKRTFLMIQELNNRLVGLQQAQEQQRNLTSTVMTSLQSVAKRIKAKIDDEETIGKIPSIHSPEG